MDQDKIDTIINESHSDSMAAGIGYGLLADILFFSLTILFTILWDGEFPRALLVISGIGICCMPILYVAKLFQKRGVRMAIGFSLAICLPFLLFGWCLTLITTNATIY